MAGLKWPLAGVFRCKLMQINPRGGSVTVNWAAAGGGTRNATLPGFS